MIYGSTWATCWWERERIWDLKWDIFLALFPAFLWLAGICLWLIISSRMNGDKRIFISSVIKRENIFQNSLVDRCLDKIHKHYFRNLKFIRKSSHTIKSTSVKFMGGEQWQCDFMTGFFLRSCWWGVVSFNRTGSVDDQWSRSDLYECQFFFSVYSHVLWGKGLYRLILWGFWLRFELGHIPRSIILIGAGNISQFKILSLKGFILDSVQSVWPASLIINRICPINTLLLTVWLTGFCVK